MAIRQCAAAHCSIADPEIYQVCVQNGLPAGYPVLTKDANGPCTCSCSCLAFGTPVQIDADRYEAIEKIVVGDYVLAAGTNLVWQRAKVEFSQGTSSESLQPFTVLLTYGDTALAVTSDHLFMLDGGRLKRADRLVKGDRLTASDGSPVEVQSVHIGDYMAGFHHIATKKEIPQENLDGHLINTNGVVSADYIVQIFHRSGEFRAGFVEDHDELPVMGSPEYIKRFGDSCLQPPEEARIARVAEAGFVPEIDTNEPVFIPASVTRLSIPPEAHAFISDEEAKKKLDDAKRPWNDPQSREWTEYLISHHRAFYPNITYHLDWANNEVNAYAWVQNGIRNVAILGGLVRHFALELEGIAVVLAHELAHHYGGPPAHPGGLSCEGQSDYHGVRTIMRRVWFGEYYITISDAGIAQMARFFGVPNNPTAPGGNAGCSHPAGSCRVATYHAAVALSGKPSCAG